jgi:uncharacterized protein (DUF362 family)/Pyruvate/2-oxoacid:ferredoxin oxidoreductase delta subunit
MNRSLVALVRCDDYDPDRVYAALTRGVNLLGGLEQFVKAGERILLKPNILAGDGPEKAVATHPAVLAGCVRLLREGGAPVCFGDSPGLENPRQAARHSGLEAAGVEAGADLVDFSIAGSLENSGGDLVSSFPAAAAIQSCHGIINLPKAKTHQLTRITGAVKNLFGCISGKRKAMYHVRFPDVADFSQLLVELGLTLHPRLHIMDAIVAMEGNGPRSGDPRPLRVLIMSEDPVAVDATFCRLIDLDPAFIPTITLGRQAGLGYFAENEIAYTGDSIAQFVAPDFKVIRQPVLSNASYAFYDWLKALVLPRPVIDPATCVRCGICVAACPVPDGALHFDNGSRQSPPAYDYDACIRCYCCHEMCPHRAIHKTTPLLGRLLRIA